MIYKSVLIVSFTLIFISLFSCKPEPSKPQPQPEPEQWEKFIGEYKVYDTLGNFLFDIDIQHFDTVNFKNSEVDCMIINNFANKFQLRFQYGYVNEGLTFLDFGFHQPAYDKNGKRWHLTRKSDDPTTIVKENSLVNDTLVFYYDLNNLLYHNKDSIPYFECYCRDVAVKQK